MGLVLENCGQWRVNEEVKQAFRIQTGLMRVKLPSLSFYSGNLTLNNSRIPLHVSFIVSRCLWSAVALDVTEYVIVMPHPSSVTV